MSVFLYFETGCLKYSIMQTNRVLNLLDYIVSVQKGESRCAVFIKHITA